MIERDSPETIAAHAMLLTLTTSVVDAEQTPGLRINPGTSGMLDWDSAISALAALPKPVCCSVLVAEGIPTVSCIPLSDADPQIARELSLVGRATWGPVLLISREAELLIPPEAMKIWHRDYRISSPYAISADAPTEEQQFDGVVRVLRVYEGPDVSVIGEDQESLLQRMREFWPHLRK